MAKKTERAVIHIADGSVLSCVIVSNAKAKKAEIEECLESFDMDDELDGQTRAEIIQNGRGRFDNGEIDMCDVTRRDA